MYKNTVGIMVKNEEKSILITLNSIKTFAKIIVIYDTGSTDNTVELIREFCCQNDIELRLKIGNFEDFATSRNKLLDFAADFSDIGPILLLDANDELRGADALTERIKLIGDENIGCLIRQEWWDGRATITYYNIRLIFPQSEWKYQGAVHEWLHHPDSQNIVMPNDVYIYQNRTHDCEKSHDRFKTDLQILQKLYNSDITNTRTVFYLAQTYYCLHMHEDALKYYKIRSQMGGYTEEVYQSYYACGEISEILGKEPIEAISFYLKSLEICGRAEPLVKIGKYYMKNKYWLNSFIFLNAACLLPFPGDQLLFVNKDLYEHERWHLLSVVAFYAGFLTEGKNACIRAIAARKMDTDMENLKFYT